MLDYKFSPNETYIAVCTFGSDSMALLDMMQKDGVKPIVAALNYHKFEESEADVSNLKSYCREKGLTLELLDTNDLPSEKKIKPGQEWKDWARKTRYDFFEQVYAEYNAKALFIAHNQDDLIEAYLLAKEGKEGTGYGMSAIDTYNNMIIVRPLLLYSKNDLLEYDHENHVPYGDHVQKHLDESTRNPIRKEVISKLSEIDRDNILNELATYKSETIELLEGLSKDIADQDELDIRTIISLDGGLFAQALITFVHQNDEHIDLTPGQISKIRKLCLCDEEIATMKLKGDIYIIKEYDKLTVGHNLDDLPYTYVLNAPGQLITEQFELDFTDGAEDRGIKADDYPITIRTALPQDMYAMSGYLVPVRVMYSDCKMPARLRAVWPVFVNKNGKIVYVPRYRTNFTEYHSSVLKIRVKDDER